MTAAPSDEVGDGADLETVELGEGHQFRQARHRAVVVHDLADDSGGIQAGKTRDIDAGFRVTGANKHAAFACDKREDVAGRDDVVGALCRIDADSNRVGAVVRGDAGGDALFRFDGDGEGRLHALAVFAGHHVEFERAGAIPREAEADQAATEARHEVDGGRRCELRGDDEVTLVLAVFRVDENIHLAVARFFHDLFDRGDGGGEIVFFHVVFHRFGKSSIIASEIASSGARTNSRILNGTVFNR